MSRFPFFREISGARVLVVGGGQTALRRAKVLAGFGAEVVCISPEFCEGFSETNVQCIRRRLEIEDVVDQDIVIAASDDHALNAAVVRFAKAQGSEVCAADNPAESTFWFPGVVCKGGMTVGISSDGASPSAVKYVREQVEAAIPENFEAVLESMETARRLAKEMIVQQSKRADILRRIFDHCIHAQLQPDEMALREMIQRLCSTDLD